MSSGLLLALAAGLLALALVLAVLVLVGVVALIWLRSRPEPAPTPAAARSAAEGEKERERQKSAARGRATSAPPAAATRGPRTVPTLERPGPPAPSPQPTTAGPLQPAPMIGFFDDETSTGAALGQARQTSLSAAFLSIPPGPSAPPAPGVQDDYGEGEATEIFSANTVSAELAALLDEPDDAPATPGPTPRRGR